MENPIQTQVLNKTEYSEQKKLEKIQRLAKMVLHYDQWPRIRSGYRNNLANQMILKFKALGYSFEDDEEAFKRIIETPIERLPLEERDFRLAYQICCNQDDEVDKMEMLSIKLNKKIIKLNNGKFPNNLEHGAEIVKSCWAVFQHSDKDLDFMKQGLRLIVEARQENFKNISPVFLMYLTDRYCFRKHSYQFCGTQNNGENTIKLPIQLEDLLQNPLKFLELIEEQISPENQTSPTNTEMLELWQAAKTDADKVYQDRPRSNQDDAIDEFIEKYSAQ